MTAATKPLLVIGLLLATLALGACHVHGHLPPGHVKHFHHEPPGHAKRH